MSMSCAPRNLDGASVLSIAPARAGQLGIDYKTGDSVAICYYAIAQYAGDEPRAYLFGVSCDHHVVGDSVWDSPAEAAQVALNSGNVSSHFESFEHPSGYFVCVRPERPVIDEDLNRFIL